MRVVLVVSLAVTLLGVSAGSAPASEKSVTVPTPNAACPPSGAGSAGACNNVYVRQFGVSASAKKVLILIPGFQGGAGDFTQIAREIVQRVPGLQVWAIDRRSQVLEDTSMFAQTLSKLNRPLGARKTALDTMFDYYLSSNSLGTPGDGFDPRRQGNDGSWAKDWGAAVTLNDVHSVVATAIEQGLTPALGGHSLGASLATMYAAWDFDDGGGGLPDGAGHSFVHGIVLIDGGGKSDSPSSLTPENATCLLSPAPAGDISCVGGAFGATSEKKFADTPWAVLLPSAPLAEAAGLFAEVGAIYARLDPRGSASRLLGYGLLPDDLKPDNAKYVTNRALLGNAFDADSSPPALGLLHVNAGRIGSRCGSTEKKRCDWVDGGLTPIARVANAFGQETSGGNAQSNGSEWYFPRRLSTDVGVGSYLQQTATGDLLGLRLTHASTINDPLFVIQTKLTAGNQSGSLVSRADNLVSYSNIPQANYVKIDASAGSRGQSHLDPLLAAPKKNQFLTSIVSFLKNKAFK